jgi:mycothiol synthase
LAPVHVQVTVRPPGAPDEELLGLLARATESDGHPALPDPLWSALTHPGPDSPSVLLAHAGPDLAGCAFVTPPATASTDHVAAVHLVVDPAHRSDSEDAAVRHALLEQATDQVAPTQPMRLWALGATAADDAVAARHGFAPERDLLQMRVPLPLPEAVRAGARPVQTRPFRPGRDEEGWLDVNNRAFAGHPEQGGWTLAQLRERLAADWVDLDGFLMADAAPNGLRDGADGAADPGLLGSCWTKVHRTTRPVLGEIYVISVDLEHHSQGWGQALTVAGLDWLAAQGITHGMLYTDAANAAAVTLYHALGFTDHHVDRAYLRPAAAADPASATADRQSD